MNDKTLLLNACLGNKKRIWEASFNLKNQLCFIYEESGKLDAALLLRVKNLDEYRSSEYSKNSPTSPVTYERLLLGTMIKMNLLALAERKIKEIYPEAYPDKGELELLMEQIETFYVKKTGSRDGLSDYKKKLHEEVLEKSKTEDVKKIFSFNTLTGKTYTENDIAGKVFVLNFWDTFCAPCIREMPDLNEVVKHFSGNPDVIFVAPSPSEKAALEKFFETPKMKFDYQIAYGAEEMLKTFEIQAIPVHIVFDKKGEIVLRQTGATPDITKQLIAAIEEALKAK
jgi:thiol-disulfide isomerase/thioredoxin